MILTHVSVPETECSTVYSSLNDHINFFLAHGIHCEVCTVTVNKSYIYIYIVHHIRCVHVIAVSACINTKYKYAI